MKQGDIIWLHGKRLTKKEIMSAGLDGVQMKKDCIGAIEDDGLDSQVGTVE